MNIIERLLLILYNLVIGCLSLFFLILPFNEEMYEWTSYIIDVYRLDWRNMIIPLLLLVVSIASLVTGLRGKRVHSNSVIRHTSFGEIRISLDTIESMTLKVSREIPGLKEIKANVHQVEDGVLIYLSVLASSEINIPETSIKLQQNIKEYIEQYTGIEVKEIKINIENMISIGKGRVE